MKRNADFRREIKLPSARKPPPAIRLVAAARCFRHIKIVYDKIGIEIP